MEEACEHEGMRGKEMWPAGLTHLRRYAPAMWSRYRQIYWSWRGISSCKQGRQTVSVLALQTQRQEHRGEG